jgi:hypothetical protein
MLIPSFSGESPESLVGVRLAKNDAPPDLFSNVEAKMGDIAILHHIIFTLKPQQALLRGSSKRATGHEYFP